MTDRTILWQTNVGSHMWNMNRPDSDYDIFEAYIVDTKELLRGRAKTESYQKHYPVNGIDVKLDTDVSGHEIGTIVQQLLKGNMNYLWGTMSPIILEQKDTTLDRLRDIVKRTIAKNCVNSIRGMVVGNYNKYILYGSNNTCTGDEMVKKCNMMCRSLDFGMHILEGDGFEFHGVSNCAPVEVQTMLKEIDTALAESKLPEFPNEEPYREFLLNLRMAYL